MDSKLLPAHIAERVKETADGCFEWQGADNGRGYGQIRVDYKLHLVHRLVYSLCVEPIPEGCIVMHTCDNPRCCNPQHLRLGTHRQNVLDKEAKGRGNAGEANGMRKLSAEDVRIVRGLYAEGFSQSEIARKFNVNRSCIWKIVHNYHWKIS